MNTILMSFDINDFYASIQVIGAFVLIFALFYVSYQKPSNIQKHLIFILLTLTISFVGYYIELIGTNFETAYLGICIGYIGKPFALFAVLLLLFEYVNLPVSKTVTTGVLIFFLFLTLMVFTNDLHHLYYYDTIYFDETNIGSPITIESKDHGPFWYIYIISSLLVFATYIGITIYEFARSKTKQAKSMAINLFLIVVFALLGLLAYITGLSGDYDTTLLGILIGVIFLIILMTRYRLFDSLTLAQRKTLNTSRNAYVILDARMQLSFYNEAAHKMIPELSLRGLKNEQVALKKLFAYKPNENIYFDGKVYALSITPTLTNSKKVVGITYSFNDITEHYYYQEKLNFELGQAVSKIKGIQRKALISFAEIVEARDGNTGEHINRVATVTRMVATELIKLPKYQHKINIDILEECAPLHDIGKIYISDTILLKEGKLTDEERKIMTTHTSKGKELIEIALSEIEEAVYLKMAKNIAHYHHERYDGTGYPDGLKGDKIPLEARIVAVADVYDALRSKRSYKEAFDKEKSLKIIMEESGSHFDPDIVEALLSIKDKLH